MANTQRLTRRDLAVLRVIPPSAGFTTRHIAVELFGNANLRRDSALLYRHLYTLSQNGYVREMDTERPIVWRLTDKGNLALATATASDNPGDGEKDG